MSATATEGFDADATAQQLLRTARHAALATLAPDGTPFVSLVAVACLASGAPVILISKLAAHTRNLAADGRASLLLTAAADDPMAAPRLSVSGIFAPMAEGADRNAAQARFLARHPEAEGYAGFADFAFWAMRPETAHLVAGFGRITDLAPERFLTDVAGAEALIAASAGAVAHMNEDHLDALALYAERLCGAAPGAWITTGVDPDGIDLMTRDGRNAARLRFGERVTSSPELRGALVRLAHAARATADA